MLDGNFNGFKDRINGKQVIIGLGKNYMDLEHMGVENPHSLTLHVKGNNYPL